jgi:hypothetical protein
VQKSSTPKCRPLWRAIQPSWVKGVPLPIFFFGGRGVFLSFNSLSLCSIYVRDGQIDHISSVSQMCSRQLQWKRLGRYDEFFVHHLLFISWVRVGIYVIHLLIIRRRNGQTGEGKCVQVEPKRENNSPIAPPSVEFLVETNDLKRLI